MMAAHVTEAPTSIATLRPALPAALADLVMRCLEKRPSDRPQRAGEIVQALEAIGTSHDVPAAARRASSRNRRSIRHRGRRRDGGAR